jgi:hypothetical protein
MFDPSTVVASVLSSAALTGALVFLLRTWIAERVKGSIKHEYDLLLAHATNKLKMESDLALERLRTAHADHSAIHSAGLASFAETRRAAHERQLIAIDTLWKEISRLRSATPPLVSAFDLYSAAEYPSLRRDERIMSLMAFDVADIRERLSPNTLVDEVRPYLDPYLYALFFAYRALPALVAFHIRDTDEPWWNDPRARKVMAGALDEAELDGLSKVRRGQFQWFQDKLELKILDRASKIIHGADASEASLKQATRLLELAGPIANNPELAARGGEEPLPNQ